MARSKAIRTTDDAFAWIAEQVAAGRLEQPQVVGEGDDALVVYVHDCTRCGGDGQYMALSGRVGVCFGCGGRKKVSKRLAPVEFARRLRRNLRAQDRRAQAKRERIEASKSNSAARGYGRVTGRELFEAKRKATAERQISCMDQRLHVGTEGELLELSVVLSSTRTVQTRFGERVVHDLVTDGGHILTFWAKAAIAEGDRPRLRIRANVKCHGAYRNEARTELSDLEILAVEGEEALASNEDLLIVADYLDQDGAETLSDVERQMLAGNDCPEWIRREWTEHPAIRPSLLLMRAQLARRVA